MSNSNYVLAGFETLSTIVSNFIENKKNDFNDNFTRQDISNFHENICHGFLHSFGQNFSGKKNYDNYVSTEVNLYKKCRESNLFNNSLFIADSGGFQASIGVIKKNETEILIKLYHEFLENYHSVIDRAFILDLTPGPGCVLFDTFKDVYDTNLRTYSMAANLPDDVRKKIIYINHFRTPKLWKIFEDLLVDNNFFEKFDHFATGGIVASSQTDTSIPCIIYVLPLIPLINQTIKHKRNYLNFHVLGGATFRDIMFYEFFQKHVFEKHGIHLKITYDSSGMFKALMLGRFITCLYDDVLYKMDIKSDKLHLRFKKNETIGDHITYLLNDMATRHNFKLLEKDRIYNTESGTFYEDVKVYLMLYTLDFYSVVQNKMKDFVNDTYHFYSENNFEELNKRVSVVTKNLNDGKLTKKQGAKTSSLIKSLDMLTDLDENFCKHLVNKVLSKDEFTYLTNSNSMLSF